MTIIDPGHLYLLNQLDSLQFTQLRFVKRVGEGYPGNQPPPYPGTNIQEVLRALIDRHQYLDGQYHHWINGVCVFLYRVAINLLEYRAAQRHHREFIPTLTIETRPIGANGHVL